MKQYQEIQQANSLLCEKIVSVQTQIAKLEDAYLDGSVHTQYYFFEMGKLRNELTMLESKRSVFDWLML